jgi:hypothetical protein
MGQKIAFAVAILCYLAAAATVAAAAWYYGQLGGENAIVASLSATVVFFVGAGIVLHVIVRADIPDFGFGPGD